MRHYVVNSSKEGQKGDEIDVHPFRLRDCFRNPNLHYSNQAFEYWLILHFDDHQGSGMNRYDYYDRINTLIKSFGASYDGKKSKLINEYFYELLDVIDEKTRENRVDLAIKRTQRNYDRHVHSSPALEESTTTVFKLVKELLRYL